MALMLKPKYIREPAQKKMPKSMPRPAETQDGLEEEKPTRLPEEFGEEQEEGQKVFPDHWGRPEEGWSTILPQEECEKEQEEHVEPESDDDEETLSMPGEDFAEEREEERCGLELEEEEPYWTSEEECEQSREEEQVGSEEIEEP